MEETTYYAHSAEDLPEKHWHKLSEHLEAAGALAAQYAGDFGSEEWGRLAGLWHDMGKYQPAFQARLRGEPVAVDHAAFGAVHAFQPDPKSLRET